MKFIEFHHIPFFQPTQDDWLEIAIRLVSWCTSTTSLWCEMVEWWINNPSRIILPESNYKYIKFHCLFLFSLILNLLYNYSKWLMLCYVPMIAWPDVYSSRNHIIQSQLLLNILCVFIIKNPKESTFPINISSHQREFI